MEKNEKIARDVLQDVGGEENINSVVHCATRLRFVLKDKNKANKSALNNNSDVIQVVESGGQFQVVIGSHVSEVYKELTKLMSGNVSNTVEEVEDNRNLLDKLIDVISSIFTPFLGAMAGAGVLKGFLSLALALSWITPESGIYVVLFAIADGIFTYLPIVLAFTAAKKFNTNQYLAVALAAALVHPSITGLTGQTLSFLGMAVIIGAGYISSVIPIILAVYVQSYVEKFFKKIIPEFLKITCVPLFVFLIMAPLTFIAIGPIGGIAGSLLGKGYNVLYEMSPAITGAVFGGLWQVLVIFGMHWAFIPIMLNNISSQGFDTMLPMLVPAVLAQGGAALGVYLKTKNLKRKQLALSSTITSLFGITEPTVYGVTLPLKKPFIFGIVGGVIGGFIIGLSNAKAYSMALISLLSIPTFIEPGTSNMSSVIVVCIATLISFVLACILTFLFGLKNEDEVDNIQESSKVDSNILVSNKAKFDICSPLDGEIVKLEDIDDKVFASGVMGKGIAINPNDGNLYSPVDGKVSAVFPSKHAVGVTSDEGVEILMHIGMDTVELAGEFFESYVAMGQEIKKGDILVSFDIQGINDKGYSTVTPIVITNSDTFLDIIPTDDIAILHGEKLITILNK